MRDRPRIASSFDPTRHVRLVPAFQDKDLDAFFQAFERNAQTLEWPKDQWVLLLSTVLKGKAQIAYTSLDSSENLEYTKVKEAILKAYELVPEAYRQKFRTLRKLDSQTHVEYVKDKERLFDRWCRARQVTEFTDLDVLFC